MLVPAKHVFLEKPPPPVVERGWKVKIVLPLNLLFSLKLSLGTGRVRIPPKLLNCKHAAKLNWRVQFGHVNVITVFI